MSRLRNFRKTIYLGMNGEGQEILLPEKGNWGFYDANGIRKISPPYQVQSENFHITTTRRRKMAPEALTPSQASAMPGIHPDNPPQGQAGGKDKVIGSKGKHQKLPSSDGFGPPLSEE